jgi:hypothetical protein
MCEGHGPLRFVAAIACGNLPHDSVDIALPADGTLLSFYFGDEDAAGRIGNRPADTEQNRALIESLKAQGLNVLEPEYWAPHPHVQAQVLYVPSGVPTTERHPPTGITPYIRVRLAAEPMVTGPDWEHPTLRAAIRDLSDEDRSFMNNPFNSDPFRLAMSQLVARPDHRIGGYADPVQGSVEVEVAHGMLGGQVEYSDPALPMLAQQWTVLAQIDTDGDAERMWGDCGTLYWLIRPDDLAASNFGAASFTWQCS